MFAGGSGDETTPTEEDHTPSDSEESDLSEDEDDDDEQSEEGSDNQEMPRVVATEKRGTEMRLSGMVMSEGVGVGRCASVRVTLQCTRCRAQQDETMKAERYCMLFSSDFESFLECSILCFLR